MAKYSSPPSDPLAPNKRLRSASSPSRDYKVGKGRPPPEHQWKPNQSGNKKGRRKGSKNRKTIVRAAERKTFSVKKAGRPRKMTATEVGLHNLQQDILRGDRKAFLDYLGIIERYGDQDETAASMQELLAEDCSILTNMLARKSRKSIKSEGDQ
jgi:hypothetical protein